MKVARVFPRRTKATPNDELAFVGSPGLFPPDVNEVHISATFTWDLPEAERLAEEWRSIAPVIIGGPATGMRGEGFTPGMYLRPGYVATSRGCPNHCWFCKVPGREGSIRELPIAEGWNVIDDNLLACSESHIGKVFDMLRRQKHPIEFTGGLEAARMTQSIACELRSLKPNQVFLAYDTPDDWDPLMSAVEMLWNAGFPVKKHCVRAYVLCGYEGDDLYAADKRMRDVLSLGVFPSAMAWRRDSDGYIDPAWADFQRSWFRPAIISSKQNQEACAQ